VRSLQEGVLPAGAHSLVWDGRDDAGQTVSAGVYFFVVTDGTTGTVRKSVRLR
jgi:flagellar hook assembly protein FlgD